MFGSGKIQMLQSQLRDANDRLDRVAREKSDLEQQLSAAAVKFSDLEQKFTAANEKISELESKLADFDLEKLKEEARTSQAEFEGLKDLYSRKVKEFDDTLEEKEQAFAREAAVSRHNLENEIHDNREANQAYVSGAVRRFSESYNFYLNQIRLLMDALGEVAARTGESLFSGIDENKDPMLTIGQEISARLTAETDDLRSEEKGLVLIANAEDIDNQLTPAVDSFASEAEEEDTPYSTEYLEETEAPVEEPSGYSEVVEEAVENTPDPVVMPEVEAADAPAELSEEEKAFDHVAISEEEAFEPADLAEDTAAEQPSGEEDSEPFIG